MTDGEAVKLARRIDDLQEKIRQLCNEIYDKHANGDAIRDSLQTNCIDNPAWATHVIHMDLQNPDQWESGYFGLRHRSATKAANKLEPDN